MFDTIRKPLANQSAIRQYYAAFVVNLFIVAFGILEGWSSPMNILLISDDTPLPSGKITMEEASWVTSLLSVGALICNIVFGYITNNFGRKIPLLAISIPMIISWLLVWFAQDPFYLYASRLIGGAFGAGGYMIILGIQLLTFWWLDFLAVWLVAGLIVHIDEIIPNTGFLGNEKPNIFFIVV